MSASFELWMEGSLSFSLGILGCHLSGIFTHTYSHTPHICSRLLNHFVYFRHNYLLQKLTYVDILSLSLPLLLDLLALPACLQLHYDSPAARTVARSLLPHALPC